MTKQSFLTLILFSLSTVTSAQDITGNIEGRVTDTTGIPLNGVNISVQSESLQGLKGTATDDKGYFKIFYLPVGNYKVQISFVGYRNVMIENVQIRLGKTTYLGEIKLEQEAIDLPEITISGEKQIIDPTSTVYGGNIQTKDYEQLPVDRDYKSIVTLLPQANTSYYGDGANIGGATGFENKYFVDGVEVTDPLIGSTGMNLPYNFIKEIELKTGGYDSESRSSLGGIINVVTLSGTNDFHASIFGFYTSNAFVGNTKLGLSDPTQGDFTNYDIGVSLGGPIALDKLWFFAAYNPTFKTREVSVPGFGVLDDKTFMHAFATKLTWSALQNLKLIVTINGDPTEQNAVGRGVDIPPITLLNPDPYYLDIVEGSINSSLNATYNLNDEIILTGTFARVMRHDTGEGSTQVGKNEVLFKDIQNQTWSGGVNSNWDSFRSSNTASFKSTYFFGSHILSGGIEYKVNNVDNHYENHEIDKIDDTTYYEYLSKGFGEVQHRIPSIYIQDKWRILDGLVISAGLRWEMQYIDGSDGNLAQTVKLPLQPRVGIIFVPDERGYNKIYGSFGRFSQEFGLFQAVNLFSEQGYSYTIRYRQDSRSDTTGAIILGGPFVMQPEIEGLRGQYFDEFSIGYERLIPWNIKLGIQGLYRTLGETIEDAFVLSDFSWHFGNPGRGLLENLPKPMRDYAALIISVERRGNENFNFLASYVLSRDYGNYEGLFDAFTHGGFPNVNLTFDNPNTARINTSGLVPNDRTHVFKFSGSYSFSFGLTTGISFILQSGTPLSEYAYRPVGIRFLSQRGSIGRTPTIWDLSARLTYELPLMNLIRSRIILDLFHIASQRKPVDIDQLHYFNVDANGNPSNPNPTYGQAYRYQQPMSMRLGMEINF